MNHIGDTVLATKLLALVLASTLQLSFQFVRELFTVYIICIVEK